MKNNNLFQDVKQDDNQDKFEKDKQPTHFPKEFKHTFLKKDMFFGLWKKKEEELHLKDPILILMYANGDMDIIHDVGHGIFQFTGSDKKEKYIVLSNTKLMSLKYGGERVKTWVAFEDEGTAYPHEVQHDSRDLRQIIQKIMIDRKELEEKSKSFNDIIMYAVIGVIIIIVIWYAWSNGLLTKIMPFLSNFAKEAPAIITENVTNTTTNITPIN